MNSKLSYLFTVIVIFLLFIFGTINIFNYFKSDEFGILSLDVKGGKNQIVATRSGELLKGDTVWGVFHSDYSNLGIVSVRFFNGNRDSDDTLIFRLKEEGQDKWYYEAKYESDQFLPHHLFPFGFPIIKDSENKSYEFQIESLRGATGSGIFIDFDHPIFVAKSSFTKSELFGNRDLMYYFAKNKLTNILHDNDVLMNIYVCFLPLLIYLVYLVTKKLSYQYLSLFGLLIIVSDLLLIKKSFDLLYMSFLFLWTLNCYRYRLESKIAGGLALVFLALIPILILLRTESIAEKCGAWAFLFFTICVIQSISEVNKKEKTLITFKSYVLDFLEFKAGKNYQIISIPKKVSNFAISSFTFLLFFSIFSKVRYTYPKFVQFFPEDHLLKFLNTVVIPELVLTLALFGFILCFYKKVSESKLLLIAILLTFNFLATKLIYNAIKFESVPTIFSVSPKVTNEAWVDITITGKNFRNIPFVGKVYIDTVEQGEYLVLWTDEKVVFRTNPGLTKTGEIYIVPLDRDASNKVHFDYTFNTAK